MSIRVEKKNSSKKLSLDIGNNKAFRFSENNHTHIQSRLKRMTWMC